MTEIHLQRYKINGVWILREPMTPEELKELTERLQRAAMKAGILRRGQLKSKKALGRFQYKPKIPDSGILKLQDAVIKDPAQYPVVLSHELAHAIEYNINGDTKSTYKLFGELTKEEKVTIQNELKEIVNNIEGEKVAMSKPEYFYKPTEMWARFIETQVLQPANAERLAPFTSKKFEELIVREPMVADLMDAVLGNLDKGFVNKTHDWVKDLRQIYRKHLGKSAGDRAYDNEVIRRAEEQRAVELIEKLLKQKFKGIKDDPKTLFRAAEAIKVTRSGKPEFGTNDYMEAFTDAEFEMLEKAGYKNVDFTYRDGKPAYVMMRPRYTVEQAERVFNELSKEGQELIKDFTAAKEEAKDAFNRELIKDLYKIDSKIEGWVHHYWKEKPYRTNNSKRPLRSRAASAKKQRTGAEGYVEDFRKAMTKALVELETSDINNLFIKKQLAHVSKPIAKGSRPDDGWTEVYADPKHGLRLPGEGITKIIQAEDGSSFMVEPKRYQVPTELVEHYRNIRQVPKEANMASWTLNNLAKYWTLNVLIQGGTASTNFISGGLQYGSKIVNDFYLDLLTANFNMGRTRSNISAPLKVLLPKNWTNAPEWVYGGYRSTMMGQLASREVMTDSISAGIDAYGNKALYVFGLVETYWKKAIMLAENGDFSKVDKSALSRLQKNEKEMMAAINEMIDTYAFDYDNKAPWLKNFDRKGGKLVKPFMTYMYKYTKFLTHFVASGFDKSLPWQERTSKILTFATIVTAITMYMNRADDENKTPTGTEDTPYQLRPGGRLYVGNDSKGREIFIRTAKYPWFNLASIGRAAATGNSTEIADILRDQIGGTGPLTDLLMLAMGYSNEYDKYKPPEAKLGEWAASWIPAFRLFNDTGNFIDPTSRTSKTFVQGVFKNLPVWGDESLKRELRGTKKVLKVPVEPDKRSISSTAKTSIEREITREPIDVLMGAFTGIYISRIDPKEATAQQLREVRNSAEEVIRDYLKEGNVKEAKKMGEQYGLTIPDRSLDYYSNNYRNGKKIK